MATNKNITMKQFNGTDYDTLYPKTKIEQVEGAYTQQQILADSTKALYGLGNDAVPDDVLIAIRTMLETMETNAVRIAIGSYSGTGKSGKNYPNSLTFDFAPKFVYIMSSSEISSSYNRLLLIRGCTKAISGESSSTENTITWSGNTVSWYTGTTQTEHIAGQLNKSGTTYRYFAVG